MGDYTKYKNVNTVFGGTGGITVPVGANAERPTSALVGTLRYNTDLGLIEQYNALGWQSVDAPPTVSNISGTINENTNSTITISGSNFKTGAVVSIEGAAVSGIPRALSTTFVSPSQLTAATNATAVNFVGGASFDVKVQNPSGLSAVLSPAGVIDRDPVWSTATGTYSVFDSARSTSLTFSAADPDGGTITYSVASGSLPSGASLNTSTGAIGPFNAVGSDTSSTFTLRATSSVGSQVADRSFTILVRAPTVQSFTSGTGNFSVPSGVTSVRVLVIAGGGSGGTRNSGGDSGGTDGGGAGGAGGYVEVGSFPVSPGGSVPYQVGGGAPATRSANVQTPGSQGQPSIFGSITAIGGGFGGCGPGGPSAFGGAGGSGGGGGGGGAPPAAPGGPGQQPGQPGFSNGFGFNGGNNSQSPPYSGSGGGGAGGNGTDGGSGRVAPGGGGRSSDITGSSVARAGGGAGGGGGPSTVVGGNASAGGGRGGGAGPSGYPSGVGENGGTNTGGGGGGGAGSPAGGGGYGGFGGPGVIIVRY